MGVFIVRSETSLAMKPKNKDKSLVPIKVEFNDYEPENLSQNVSEILVERLSIEPGDSSLDTTPPQKQGVIAYLGFCHKLASEQLRFIHEQNNANSKGEANKQMQDLLLEVQKQV